MESQKPKTLSPENKQHLAELKRLEEQASTSQDFEIRSFDLKALALQTKKIYEKFDPVLGKIRYGILTEAEANELGLEELSAQLMPLQNKVAMEQANYDRLLAKNADQTQMKTTAELIENAKKQLQQASVKIHQQVMYRTAFGMLHKADPLLTEQDWDATPFNAKALVTEALAKEMGLFLTDPPPDGLKQIP